MIENYYRLLFAIFNSDSDDDCKYENPVIAYDIYDDLPIGVFKNGATCAKFFKTSRSVICNDICRNHLKNDRYKIERLDKE